MVRNDLLTCTEPEAASHPRRIRLRKRLVKIRMTEHYAYLHEVLGAVVKDVVVEPVVEVAQGLVSESGFEIGAVRCLRKE